MGDLVVTAVYDGYVALDPMTLTDLSDAERADDLAKQMQLATGNVNSSVNAFLVHDGARLVLVDAGSANFVGPTMGKMLASIEAAGYNAADVDTILLTHRHPDHIGGITDEEGDALFPNATVWGAKVDADFWLDSATVDKLSERAAALRAHRARSCCALYRSKSLQDLRLW